MSKRYLSNLMLTLGAGFLLVASQSFPATTVAWVTFAIAIGLTLVSDYMLASGKTWLQLALGGAGFGLGLWTIIASLTFGPGTAMWIGFASAIAFVAIGVTGLTAHEVISERMVRALERGPRRRAGDDGSPATT